MRFLAIHAVTSAAALSIASRIIVGVTGIVVIPLTLRYLSVEEFGAWALIGSLSAILGIAELGIGNAVIQRVSAVMGSGDSLKVQHIWYSAIVLTSVAGGLALSISLVAISSGALSVFGSVFQKREVIDASILFAVLFCIYSPMSLCSKVLMGTAKIRSSALITFLSAAFSSVALICLSSQSASLVWLVAAVNGVPCVVEALAVLTVSTVFPHLRPQRPPNLKAVSTDLLALSVRFGAASASSNLAFSALPMIIGATHGPAAVAAFNIATRILGVPAQLVGVLVGIFWPELARCLTSKDSLRRVFKTMVVFAAAAAWGALALIAIAFNFILAVVSADKVIVEVSLISALAALAFLAPVAGSFSAILNATGDLTLQLRTTLLLCAVSVPLNFWLATQCGSSAAVWGYVFSATLCCYFPWACKVRKIVL